MMTRARLVPFLAVGAVVVVAVTLVALSLRQPQVPMYAPTPPAPKDTGPVLVGPIVYTVDATDAERWRYFSFRVSAVVDDPSARAWDLAFRRYQIIANGGSGFRGRAGIVDLGPVRFDAVHTVPADGYLVNEGKPDPRNPAIAGWYQYGFFSHVLSPKPHVWAVRTSEGRYAKLEMLGYYCPGSQPGCVTFRYVYQGDGSPAVSKQSALR
jgi:hypothetical protein